ncbi:unnamed protein product, partial [Prorocentrum cordatum]
VTAAAATVVLSSIALFQTSPSLFATMVGYAVIYNLAMLVIFGTPLVRLQSRVLEQEASLRFGLTHVRENAEAVALYGGAASERSRCGRLLSQAASAPQLGLSSMSFGMDTGGGSFVGLFPYVVLAPAIFVGEMEFGTAAAAQMLCMQLVGAMIALVGQMDSLSTLAAHATRVRQLEEALAAGVQAPDCAGSDAGVPAECAASRAAGGVAGGAPELLGAIWEPVGCGLLQSAGAFLKHARAISRELREAQLARARDGTARDAMDLGVDGDAASPPERATEQRRDRLQWLERQIAYCDAPGQRGDPFYQESRPKFVQERDELRRTLVASKPLDVRQRDLATKMSKQRQRITACDLQVAGLKEKLAAITADLDVATRAAAEARTLMVQLEADNMALAAQAPLAPEAVTLDAVVPRLEVTMQQFSSLLRGVGGSETIEATFQGPAAPVAAPGTPGSFDFLGADTTAEDVRSFVESMGFQVPAEEAESVTIERARVINEAIQSQAKRLKTQAGAATS